MFKAASVRSLASLSDRVGVPMVRLAMAWALRNPDLTAVLVRAGSRRITRHLATDPANFSPLR